MASAKFRTLEDLKKYYHSQSIIELKEFISNNKAQMQTNSACAKVLETCIMNKDYTFDFLDCFVRFLVLTGIDIFPYLNINADNIDFWNELWAGELSFEKLNYTVKCLSMEIIPSYMFDETDLKKIILPNVDILSEGSCANTDITEINLPKCRIIGEEALRGCEDLRVVIAPKIEAIKDNAFYKCSNIKKFVLSKFYGDYLDNIESKEDFLTRTNYGYHNLNDIEFEFV